MYAIIRTGGKQAKVHEGDVLDIERIRNDGDEVTFTPLLVVADDGSVTSGREALADAKVVAKILGPSAGPKVDIFKYKNKTGNRNRQGHRQKYTRIEVTEIALTGTKKKKTTKKSSSKKAAAADSDEAKTEAAVEAAATAEAGDADADADEKES